jgi:hypothetical protein
LSNLISIFKVKICFCAPRGNSEKGAFAAIRAHLGHRRGAAANTARGFHDEENRAKKKKSLCIMGFGGLVTACATLLSFFSKILGTYKLKKVLNTSPREAGGLAIKRHHQNRIHRR